MRQFVCILFPMSAIKLNQPNVVWKFIQTVHIDINSIWIRARNIERFNTTSSAEIVLSDTAIPSVSLEDFISRNQCELILRYD